jgi:hypothetical protein
VGFVDPSVCFFVCHRFLSPFLDLGLTNGGQGRSGKLGSLFKRIWIEDRQCVFMLWFSQALWS